MRKIKNYINHLPKEGVEIYAVEPQPDGSIAITSGLAFNNPVGTVGELQALNDNHDELFRTAIKTRDGLQSLVDDLNRKIANLDRVIAPASKYYDD